MPASRSGGFATLPDTDCPLAAIRRKTRIGRQSYSATPLAGRRIQTDNSSVPYVPTSSVGATSVAMLSALALSHRVRVRCDFLCGHCAFERERCVPKSHACAAKRRLCNVAGHGLPIGRHSKKDKDRRPKLLGHSAGRAPPSPLSPGVDGGLKAHPTDIRGPRHALARSHVANGPVHRRAWHEMPQRRIATKRGKPKNDVPSWARAEVETRFEPDGSSPVNGVVIPVSPPEDFNESYERVPGWF